YLQSIPITALLISKISYYPPISFNQIKSNQAIVVVGGGVNKYGPEYSHKVSLSANTNIRLAYTAYIAKLNESIPIVVSGGYTGNIREANLMKEWLIDLYNVKNQIIIENKSRTTDENAKFVAQILIPQKITHIILVTQAYHMRRALMLFDKYHLIATPASTDYYSTYSAFTPVLAFIPSAGAMTQVAIMYHEILGYWFNKYIN
ncbi:MAG: YdcF family protein, partial [Burkholderiales bacterium]|nr:YdcF family protein [Burkholderiales bacterium]